MRLKTGLIHHFAISFYLRNNNLFGKNCYARMRTNCVSFRTLW